MTKDQELIDIFIKECPWLKDYTRDGALNYIRHLEIILRSDAAQELILWDNIRNEFIKIPEALPFISRIAEETHNEMENSIRGLDGPSQ